MQIQFLNTAGGTERLHTNLYNCGKVCISLLGNSEGESGERWDPKVSCLGQVLVAVQSLILGDHESEGKAGSVVTINGHRVNVDEYFDRRIATIRYCMIAALQGCRGVGPFAGLFVEFIPIIRSYFLSNRHRLLSSLRIELRTLRELRSRKELKLEKEILKLVEEFRLLA